MGIENTTVNVDYFQQLLNSGLANDYWTYNGSLTTPECTEAVNFVIFQQPLAMS